MSLAPHLTELVYAAGGGDTLVGTVEFSDFPEAARALPRVGDAWRVDLERLLALHPDIVLTWTSGTPPDIVARLDTLHLRRVDIATFRLADVPVALQTLGELTGTPAIARAAADSFSTQIAALRDRYAHATPVTVFIQLDDQPLFTVNSRHIISEIVELCGGRNVFATLPQLAPSISVEAVVARRPAGDPEHRRYDRGSRGAVAVVAAPDVRAFSDDLSDPRGPRCALDAAARTGHARNLREPRGCPATSVAALRPIRHLRPALLRSCRQSTSLPCSCRASTRAITNSRSDSRFR